MKWTIGSGKDIDLFTKQWIRGHDNPYAVSNVTNRQTNLKVCHLINQDQKYWREPLIRSLFPDHMIRDILAMHIPVSAQEDRRIWPCTKSSQYFVKTGYFFAKKGDYNLHHSQKMWSKLWALNVPPKFSFFIWRVVHGIIAVKASLIRRKI